MKLVGPAIQVERAGRRKGLLTRLFEYPNSVALWTAAVVILCGLLVWVLRGQGGP